MEKAATSCKLESHTTLDFILEIIADSDNLMGFTTDTIVDLNFVIGINFSSIIGHSCGTGM